MGKGYPMWVKDTFEYGTITQSYRALCSSHEMETAFHAAAKRSFAQQCRANPTIGTAYNHSLLRDSAEKSKTELTGGLLMTGY